MANLADTFMETLGLSRKFKYFNKRERAMSQSKKFEVLTLSLAETVPVYWAGIVEKMNKSAKFMNVLSPVTCVCHSFRCVNEL